MDLGLLLACTQDFVAIYINDEMYLYILNTFDAVCVMFSYSEGGLYILIAHTAGFICMYK